MDDEHYQAPDRVPPVVRCREVGSLYLAGWTHRTAPLDVLEQVAVPRSQRLELLHRLRAAGHPEAVVLSTCSRTEVYLRLAEERRPDPLGTLAAWYGGPAGALPPGLVRTGEAVTEHLFDVAAGLNSRVVGEVEIRDQVRTALHDAEVAGAAGPTLRRLFSAALRSAARVQERTGLGAQGRSMGRSAVDAGLEHLGTLAEPYVLVVGAGRMARTAVDHLSRCGVRAHVAARDSTQAARLVGTRRTCPLPALQAGIDDADLLICATSASSYVVTADHVRRAMQDRSAPLTVVDLSVPRNVDSAVADVPGVRLVDLAGMHDASGQDPAFQEMVRAAQELMRAERRRYLTDAAGRAAAPVIAQMRQQVEQLCLAELVRKGPPGLQRAQTDAAVRAIAGKLLHGPVLAARSAAADGDHARLELLRGLFDLTAGQDAGARTW